MVGVVRQTRTDGQTVTASALVTTLGGIAGTLASVFRPFSILAVWQLSFGLFVYFFPDPVSVFVSKTGWSWAFTGLVCGFVRLASAEFLRK
jgi:hypothetical protein